MIDYIQTSLNLTRNFLDTDMASEVLEQCDTESRLSGLSHQILSCTWRKKKVGASLPDARVFLCVWKVSCCPKFTTQLDQICVHGPNFALFSNNAERTNSAVVVDYESCLRVSPVLNCCSGTGICSCKCIPRPCANCTFIRHKQA